MKKLNEMASIRDLFAQGYSKMEIGKILGIDRKTVHKYVNMDDFTDYLENHVAASWIPTRRR